MKKFVLFALSTILFMCSAFCSPHDGNAGVSAQKTKFSYCQLQKDIPSIIPLQIFLQPIQAQQYRLRTQRNVFAVLENRVNSTLFYRNFGTSYASKKIYNTVIKETYDWYLVS